MSETSDIAVYSQIDTLADLLYCIVLCCTDISLLLCVIIIIIITIVA